MNEKKLEARAEKTEADKTPAQVERDIVEADKKDAAAAAEAAKTEENPEIKGMKADAEGEIEIPEHLKFDPTEETDKEEEVLDAPVKKVTEKAEKPITAKFNEALDAKPANEEASIDDLSNEDLALKLLTDPEAAMAKLTQRVKASIEKDREVDTVKARAWEQFYQHNNDLAPHKKLVTLILNEKMSEWKDLSWEDGAARLAEETRLLLKELRGEAEELDDREAKVLSSSGNPAPATRGMKSEAPKGFVEQLRAFQAKKRNASLG